MWGRLFLLSALLCPILGTPINKFQCMKDCQCKLTAPGTIRAKCSNLEFLKNVHPKQAEAITQLDLSFANISVVPKLKVLPNLGLIDLSHNDITVLPGMSKFAKLKKLKLSHNHIKDITATKLPKTLESLDLSFNNFVHIPDMLVLPNLKRLNFADNPIACTCDHRYVHMHHNLVARGVVFVKPIICKQPEEYNGKPLSAMRCKHNHVQTHKDTDMIGDDPLANEVMDDEGTADNDNELDKDFIVGKTSPVIYGVKKIAPEEGSGHDNISDDYTSIGKIHYSEEETSDDYEGSGEEVFGEPEWQPGPICRFNCSTLSSVESTDNPDASPLPPFIDQAKIILEDIKLIPTVTTTVVPRKNYDISERRNLNKPKTTKTLEESPTKDVNTGEAKTNEDAVDGLANGSEEKASTAFVVIAALLVLVAGLIFYVSLKKYQRNKRARRNNFIRERASRSREKSKVEMAELLNKSETETVSPTSTAKSPEKSPLLNGQNGTNGVSPKDTFSTQETLPLTSPDAHESIETPQNGTSSHGTSPNGTTFADVNLRYADDEHPLAPETKRITVQALELSSPTTPVLVNRKITDDGAIITVVSDGSP